MFRIFSLLIGYALGLIQTAYIAGKLTARIDIRKYGSGGAGATNTLRVLGLKAGALVFVCDILKGVLAYLICSLLFKGSGTFTMGDSLLPGLYGGLGCILGHCFPFYLKFKGGKGMASTLGIILCINPYLIVAVAVVGIICVAASRYVSVASLVISAMLPIGMFILKFNFEEEALSFIIGAIIWYSHRGNIERLIKGEENRFTFKVKSKFKDVK